MKILFLENWIHPKNRNALEKYKNIEFVYTTQIEGHDLSIYDAVYSAAQPIEISQYPNTKFIFGPHFSVFPESYQMNIIRYSNALYIQLSDWSLDIWKNNPVSSGVTFTILPFGVDTEQFNEIKPFENRDKVFVYYKSRHPYELEFLKQFLNNKGIEYKMFDYNVKYPETEYLEYLHESKYGIWLGRHESQGFALQEALSCNVPLFVWDVTSMNQEYGYAYADIKATCIPYWDDSCGEYFTHPDEMVSMFDTFLSRLPEYKPRDYILNTLSIDKCAKLFEDTVHNM